MSPYYDEFTDHWYPTQEEWEAEIRSWPGTKEQKESAIKYLCPPEPIRPEELPRIHELVRRAEAYNKAHTDE